MDVPTWRGAINKLRYGLARERQLDDGTVERYALALIGQRAFAGTPEEFVRALSLMLGSEPTTGLVEIPHGEDEFRSFARQLLVRLEEMRPWPEPPFRKVDTSYWPSFRHGAVVGRIRRSGSGVENYLRERFDAIPGAAGSVLILRLGSGDMVALLHSQRSDDRSTVVVVRDDADRSAALEAFLRLTELPREWLEVLGPETAVEPRT